MKIGTLQRKPTSSSCVRAASSWLASSKTGSFYDHCDWHASHYVKIMLDQVFGENQFQNEIVWKRTPFAGSSKALARQYPRSHDVLLFYTNGDTWDLEWTNKTLLGRVFTAVQMG